MEYPKKKVQTLCESAHFNLRSFSLDPDTIIREPMNIKVGVGEIDREDQGWMLRMGPTNCVTLEHGIQIRGKDSNMDLKKIMLRNC